MGVTKTCPGSFNEVLITQANGRRKVIPKVIMRRWRSRYPMVARHCRARAAGRLIVAVVI
jgi:hypothetical protein